MVECQLPKLNVEGSIPFSRSNPERSLTEKILLLYQATGKILLTGNYANLHCDGFVVTGLKGIYG